ncbi:hypothetical protein WAE56_18495 [Iodobacter sp. LRB]|uniref:hypothetical protein n=1 Tax=unclassified Iodobacter TaxID=235634 RepID=UPI000C0F067D|nr:hypothetical protein [Iodobacter sp. BJB302]PHU99950.1 hypothetical protein CSQ88_19785 [Iodobacter sp. BJB302]
MISTISGVIPDSMQVAGACITAVALLLNDLYQRRMLKNKLLLPHLPHRLALLHKLHDSYVWQ